MRFADITPVVLTYNEENNIGRCLKKLAWANRVVVVDSFSADRTTELASQFANVQLFSRRFDNHSNQWNFALKDTGITTDWVLTLDADYILSNAFIRELENIAMPSPALGYEAEFRFLVCGHPLRKSIYPGRIILFRKDSGKYYQDGHTQRLDIAGPLSSMKSRVDLDDRKRIDQWIVAQDKYACLERDKLLTTARSQMHLPDRLRSYGFFAPLLILFYCLFVKRMIFDGLPGWYYSYQRMTAEILLSLYLMETRLRNTMPDEIS